jgi:CO/xanthine dehydrogenase Mo-binding subunit
MIVRKLLEVAALKMKERWNEKEFETEANYKYPEGYSWDAVNFVGDAYNTYSWGANVVEVEVDKVTYEVNVRGVWTAYDVGKAIDDRIMKGQIDGGVLQGLGHAGMEVMNVRDGKLLQRTNTDYVIPTAVDFPEIKSELIDNPYRDGPYGAKSAGELTLIGAPPAYALAVQHATGKLINKIPVTPEYLMEVMQDGR